MIRLPANAGAYGDSYSKHGVGAPERPVKGVYSMTMMEMPPLGVLLAGVIAARFGAPATVAIGGAACLVSAGIF